MSRALVVLAIAGGLMLPVPGHADEEETSTPRGRDYESVLEALQEQHAQRPGDLDVLERIGVAHYRLGQHEAALRAFEQLVEKAPESERARAHYNLANAAFQSGQLDRAIEHYRETLKAEPGAKDAAHNLELIERLLAEHQKQQQQQARPQGQEPERDDTDDGEQKAPSPENSESETKSNEAGEPEPGEREPGEPDPSSESPDRGAPKPTPGDRDGDGIPNRVERRSEHGSNPRVADTDGDGLLDGEEDRNRNGRVDPGETDPAHKDSDRDGIPD
ncbi:MAG: tetratricopeptide repeat protein, partial [Myxococcota bacterium]